jgi:F-type H+-transporting ATPase subunit alpha
LHSYLKDKHSALLSKLEADKAMDKAADAELNSALTAFKQSFA